MSAAVGDGRDIRARVESIGASEHVTKLRSALAGDSDAVWLVGGAVRDLLIGRVTDDLDLAVAGDSKRIARALHEHFGGDIFSLSDRFGTWRVLPADANWRIDITGLRADTIEQDLVMRDFTVNALALPLALGSTLIDPTVGLADIDLKLLRIASPQAYSDDPLRPLRLPRFAATLGFEPEAETASLTRLHAGAVKEVAAERIFAELRDLIRADGVLRGLELLDELGLTATLLPELSALKGVEQSVYHHLDAYGHTIEVLTQMLKLEADLAGVFGSDAAPLADALAEPLADETTRGEALRWSALFHDIAKSQTRIEFPDGRVGFPNHDRRGADITRAICSRLHTSEKFSQYLAALTRQHLRLGFLVHQRPLSRREIYKYMTKCDPVEVEVGVLSVSDRLATRGRKADPAIKAHLQLAAELNGEALAWRRAGQPPPLLRGDELAERLGIKPGPQLGELLEVIAEARFAGEVANAEEAVELARTHL